MSSWLFYLLPTPSLSNYRVWREEEVQQLLYTMVKADWFRRGIPANPNKAGREETGRCILRKTLKSWFFPPSNLNCTSMILTIQTYKHIWWISSVKKMLNIWYLVSATEKSLSLYLYLLVQDQEAKYLK